jgi:hypothetical protein
VVRWVLTYDGAGVLTKNEEWRPDGSITIRHYVNGKPVAEPPSVT